MTRINLLAISGSLRSVSFNTAIINAMSQLPMVNNESMSTLINFEIYDGMALLPLFNPDLEAVRPPEVYRLKSMLAVADGLILASPEYAHGITGVMKNALDWLVSGDEFINIPVSLVNTSPRAKHAQEAIREVIKTMSGNIIEAGCMTVPLLGSDLNCEGILEDVGLIEVLSLKLDAFTHAVEISIGQNVRLTGRLREL